MGFTSDVIMSSDRRIKKGSNDERVLVFH